MQEKENGLGYFRKNVINYTLTRPSTHAPHGSYQLIPACLNINKSVGYN